MRAGSSKQFIAGFMLVAGASLLAVGCGSGAQQPPRAHPAVTVRIEPILTPEASEPDAEAIAAEAALERLYVDLETHIRQFESGLEMLLDGDRNMGSEVVAAATASIRSGTLECSLNDGCDLDIFFAAYDYLLEEQNEAFRDQGLRLVESEPEPELGLEEEPQVADFPSEPPPVQRSVNLFRGRELRELIELNAPVKAALDDWLTWMRPDLLTSWHNYQFLRSQMAPIYEQAGLPEALLFGMLATESGGKVHAYSSAGAAGPLQFMRATGRAYGLRDVGGFDQRLDPQAATRANVAYLNYHLRLFDNDLPKVLAAYNGGESRMRRIQKSYGGTPLWDRRVYYQLPRETRDYVPRVLAAALIFLEPERFKVTFPSLETSTTRLALKQTISLGELSVCLGQEGSESGWFRTLRNLNPQLKAGDRVPEGRELVVPQQVLPVYEADCLGSPLLAEAREFSQANYPAEPSMIPYRVRNGDTLGRIASRYPCVGLRELAAINRVRGPNYLIRVGQTLRIPDCT